MVFSTAETIGMTPAEFLFDDVPGLLPIHSGDGLDWLPSGPSSEFDDDEEPFSAAPFTDTFFPEQDSEDNVWGDDEDDEANFDLIDQVLSSGATSPTNEFPFSTSSSDADSNDMAAKRKRKSSTPSDEEFKVKKGKGKKGAISKPVLKQIRRVQDDATLKAINTLRAESGDHPDSRRRIHNVLERKRRNDLKYCYQELRESIPELEATERTPTGTILARAAEYIRRLQEEEKKVEAGLNAARMENELLRRQLGLF